MYCPFFAWEIRKSAEREIVVRIRISADVKFISSFINLMESLLVTFYMIEYPFVLDQMRQ